MKVSILAAVIMLAGGSAVAASYDDSWYRAPFWSGEYPDGFSVVKSTTVQLRPVLDKDAEKTIACDLPQGATYQPWNQSRVEEQGLAFVSFTKIGDYKMLKPLETTLYRRTDATELQVKLSRGETWRYLVYLGEGAFLMEYKGEEFDGNPDMLDASEQQGDANGYEEWLRINCPNNQWGWLYMGDVTLDDGTFVAPNITNYGESTDLE
jgi:hypothetical protein